MEISPEATQIELFARLIRRDLSVNKEIAKKEFSFLYFYINPLSEFFYITDLDLRKDKIIEALSLGYDWIIDRDVENAINQYAETCVTIHGLLYEGACSAAMACNDYFKDAKTTLKEKDNKGQPILDIAKLTTALARVPKIMLDLSTAYKALVVEQRFIEGKKKGSKQLNMFEDGFRIKDEQISDSVN